VGRRRRRVSYQPDKGQFISSVWYASLPSNAHSNISSNVVTGESRHKVWGPRGEHAVWVYNRSLGQRPQRGLGVPCGQGSWGKVPKIERFYCICITWWVGQFVPKSAFCKTKQNSSDAWDHTPLTLGPATECTGRIILCSASI